MRAAIYLSLLAVVAWASLPVNVFAQQLAELLGHAVLALAWLRGVGFAL